MVVHVNSTIAELEKQLDAASDADDYETAGWLKVEVDGFTHVDGILKKMVKRWAEWEASLKAAEAARNFSAAKAIKENMDAMDAWASSVDADCTFAQLLEKLLLLKLKVTVAPDGTVLEPPAAFDVTVAPGANVQEACDRCPPGGSVLLLPGTHAGPLVLAPGQEVNLFGRGLATLRTATGTVLTSEAAKSTVDGLLIRREAGNDGGQYRHCVWIKGGALRLQNCDVTSAAASVGVWIEGGANPVAGSKHVRPRSGCLFFGPTVDDERVGAAAAAF